MYVNAQSLAAVPRRSCIAGTAVRLAGLVISTVFVLVLRQWGTDLWLAVTAAALLLAVTIGVPGLPHWLRLAIVAGVPGAALVPGITGSAGSVATG